MLEPPTSPSRLFNSTQSTPTNHTLQQLGVRCNDWQPDATTLSQLSAMEPPLGFLMKSPEGSVRSRAERGVRDYSTSYDVNMRMDFALKCIWILRGVYARGAA